MEIKEELKRFFCACILFIAGLGIAGIPARISGWYNDFFLAGFGLIYGYILFFRNGDDLKEFLFEWEVEDE